MSTLQEQILCIKRELGMRKRVYPKWVHIGKMQQSTSDKEIQCMQDVLNTLETIDLKNEGLGI